MWLKDLRSVVADGVKEFQQGALTEVQHGISEVRSTSPPFFPHEPSTSSAHPPCMVHASTLGRGLIECVMEGGRAEATVPSGDSSADVVGGNEGDQTGKGKGRLRVGRQRQVRAPHGASVRLVRVAG
jgi:hypothetical protein